MDTLQSLLSAQAPLVDDADLPEAMVYAPVVDPQDDGSWTGNAGEATDRAIFAEMVTGG